MWLGMFQVEFLDIPFNKSMHISTCFPERWRVIEEVPRCDTKAFGKPLLRNIEAFCEESVLLMLVDTRPQAIDRSPK